MPDWISNIYTGPDENDQQVEFHVTTSDDDLFQSIPLLSKDGHLSLTPNPERIGSATVSVYMSDDGGSSFGGCDTSDTKQFTITVNQTIYPLTVLQEGSGSIKLDGISILPMYTKLYNAGSMVEISATPDPDWLFSHWYGDITSTEQNIQFSMNKPISLTAKFYEPPVTLSVIGKNRLKSTLLFMIYPGQKMLINIVLYNLNLYQQRIFLDGQEILTQIIILSAYKWNRTHLLQHFIKILLSGQPSCMLNPKIWVGNIKMTFNLASAC
ncbi:MAG: hypothetical protein OMM_05775 [Candidatus Magnetoglobus multicellularis str. Araruama]|uniref:Bacterial repeat domain-containing protein n=1 Tax=Candidatus Magnetoglobus multicellularis str. Araruama TaxID=890399 RepID=A0A1V1NUC1_9BACT|nr:MAG: hypothetical protein OMM_05775 [Candidatus Magnetoglobus multicellularis str. Araruama]